MKMKKIMLITCLLLAILTIGAVSASEDIASDDNLTASDTVSVVADDDIGDESPDEGGEGLDDEGDGDDEDEDEGMLYIDSTNVITRNNREAVGLNTEMEVDSGRLVVFDNLTGDEYFNSTLADMEYNTDWMKYKTMAYDGYYLFADDLDVPESGFYLINATYYDDDYNIIETDIGWVFLDLDSYINEGEVDISDNTTILISLFIDNLYVGNDIVVVDGIFNEEDEDYGGPAVLYSKLIYETDENTILNLTNEDLKLEPGEYYVYVICRYNYEDQLDDDELDDGDEHIHPIYIIEGELTIVDNTKFRAYMDEDKASLFSTEEIFFVYCPEYSAYTNLTIKVNDEVVTVYEISPDETDSYVGFYISELEISDVGDYYIDIYDDNNTQLIETYEYTFENPIEFSEVCIIESDDDRILEFRVPEGFDDGRLELTDEEDNILFNSTLSDMESFSLGWDEGFIRYEIAYDDLSEDLEEGDYLFFAAFISDDYLITNNATVTIVSRNIVEDGDVSIEIFDYLVYNMAEIDDEEPDVIAEVITATDEGYVEVYIGDELIDTLYVGPDDMDEDVYVYSITTLTFEEYFEDNDVGTYPITVSYFDDEDNEVLNLTADITFINEGDDDDDDETIFVDILSWDVYMKDDWQFDVVVDLTVLNDFDGSIVIVLDDVETEIDLSELEAIEDTDDEEYVHYYITFNDLDNEEYTAGPAEIFVSVYEEDIDEPVWSYDEPDIINFYEEQIAGNENVTIEIIPTPQIIPEYIIYITADDDSDNVTVIIDGYDEFAISIPLSEIELDDNGYYKISTEDLNILTGIHTLNVTYGDVSLEGTVDLRSRLVIDMPMDDELIYTGELMDCNIISFRLVDEEIGEQDPEMFYGNVAVWVWIDEENSILAFEGEINELEYFEDSRALVIRLSDLEGCSDLNGTYEVIVVYDGGSEASTTRAENVTFVAFEADLYEVEFAEEELTDLDDIAFRIVSYPDVNGAITIKVDGEEVATIVDFLDDDWIDDDNAVAIGLSNLAIDENGVYNLTVFYKIDEDSEDGLELAAGTITVNLDDDDDDDETVFVDIESWNVYMKGDWQFDVVVDLTVLKDFEGSIAIVLDNVETEIDLSELEAVDDIEDEEYVHYYITFNDLDNEEYTEGTAMIFVSVYEEDIDEPVWSQDEPDFINFYEEQIAGDENVTIEIIPTPQIIPEYIIYITANDDSGNVTVIIDGYDDFAISIPLSEIDPDDDGYYKISTERLEIETGIHILNVTYGNVSLEGAVDLRSRLFIDMPTDDEFLYTGTGIDPIVISFTLVNDEIGEQDPEMFYGNVTVWIWMDEETPNIVFEGEINELEYDEDSEALVIYLSDLEGCSDLNGTYEIIVDYTDGSEAQTTRTEDVTFVAFGADLYEVEFAEEELTDLDDIAFRIVSYPYVDGALVIKIGDEEVARIVDFLDDDWIDDDNAVAIGLSNLAINENGVYNLTVFYMTDEDSEDGLELANGNITVIAFDEPVDPELDLLIQNFEENTTGLIIVDALPIFSGNVTVQIGSDYYYVYVEDGIGTEIINPLAAGTYKAIATSEATDDFLAGRYEWTFNVTAKPAEGGNTTPVTPEGGSTTPVTPEVTPTTTAKETIKLTLKTVKIKKSAKKLVLKATLKINGKAKKGKILKFKFKGKTYKAKTNKKGVAKVTIKKSVLKKLKVGKKVKYQVSYGKKTVKKTAKVKK